MMNLGSISTKITEHSARCLKITAKVSFNIASEATFSFWVDKSQIKMPKMVHFGVFLKACAQTVLPDRSALIGQKLVENAKIENSNATYWMIFKHCAVYENC